MDFVFRKLSVVVILSTLLTATVYSHHSFAPYDMERMTSITGTVVDFRLANPHGLLQLSVPENGGEVIYEVEMGAALLMRRRGMTEDSMQPGDIVTVTGPPARDSSLKIMIGMQFVADDGTPIGARGPGDQRGGVGMGMGGGGRGAPPAASVAPLQGPFSIDHFAGVWQGETHPNANTQGPTPFELRADIAEARENFDPLTSPAMRCIPPNVPGMFYVPYLVKTEVTDEYVVLHHEYYDVRRVIPLSDTAEQVEATGLFGFGKARLDGESLIVETEDFPAIENGLASLFDANGRGADVPSSLAKKLTEVYTLGNSGRMLHVHYTLEDDNYLLEPFETEFRWNRLDSNTTLQEFECDHEISVRTLENVVR